MSIVGSWELDSCSEPTMWAPLARAYLDASAHLCEAMISGTFPRTYSHGITILGLAHHSVELFYKGVIHVTTGKMPSSTHNLHTLEKCVKQIAPDIAAAFAPLFGFKVTPEGEDAITQQKTIEQKRDQRFRYHHDKDGKRWPGVQGFKAETFLPQLRECFSQYEALMVANKATTP